MSSYYGVDSVTPINNIISTIKSYGHTPAFFCRYVQPCPYEGLNQDSAALEASSAYNNGVDYILPVTDPDPSRVSSGTQQAGTQDGNTVCGNIRSAINNANYHLALPTSLELDVYLDVEGSVGQDYWKGWAAAVNSYYDPIPSAYPYYASAYTNAIRETAVCSASTCPTAGSGATQFGHGNRRRTQAVPTVCGETKAGVPRTIAAAARTLSTQ
jgi:hypothetical protein